MNLPKCRHCEKSTKERRRERLRFCELVYTECTDEKNSGLFDHFRIPAQDNIKEMLP